MDSSPPPAPRLCHFVSVLGTDRASLGSVIVETKEAKQLITYMELKTCTKSFGLAKDGAKRVRQAQRQAKRERENHSVFLQSLDRRQPGSKNREVSNLALADWDSGLLEWI